MFCHQCGNQALVGAEYCQKCGVKLLTDDTVHTTPTTRPQAPSSSVSTTGSESIVQAVQSDQSVKVNDFKVFVDEHVRSTTKFQSADDLLKNSKPLRFIWICIGIPAIVGFALGGPLGLLLLGGLIGYTAVFIASGIIRMRYRGRFGGEFNGDIDIEELFVFLNKHLKQINPNFHEWSYLSSTGGLLTIIENAATNAAKEVRLCAEYGPKKKRLVVLTIKQNPDDPTAIRRYFVDATKNGFSLDGRANGMLGHGTLIRTAPILQAAMECYLQSKKLK